MVMNTRPNPTLRRSLALECELDPDFELDPALPVAVGGTMVT
jgi:hypothetical protein